MFPLVTDSLYLYKSSCKYFASININLGFMGHIDEWTKFSLHQKAGRVDLWDILVNGLNLACIKKQVGLWKSQSFVPILRSLPIPIKILKNGVTTKGEFPDSTGRPWDIHSQHPEQNLCLHYNKPKSEHHFFRLLDMTNPHLLYISGFVMTSRWILDRRRIRFLGSNSWKSQNFEKMQMTCFWKRLIKPDNMAKTEFWNSDSWLRNTSKTKIAPYLYLHYVQQAKKWASFF